MFDGVDAPREEAHGELALARIALAGDDLHHAARHVAHAIEHAPHLPEVHEMLAQLAARSGGGLDLFPLRRRNPVGAVVAHAHLLAPIDPMGALRLLSRATAFDPDKPWADAAWVHAVPGLALDPGAFVRLLVAMMNSLGDPAPPAVREANRVYLELTRRVLAAHPDNGMLHGAAAGLYRRLGGTAEAVRLGKRGVRLSPDKLTHVWYAYALKADAQLEAALSVMRDARQRYPLDLDLAADMANWLNGAGRIEEAVALIEEALRVDPTYDCAVHTVHRLRFARDGQARHLIALADYIRANPVSTHEHSDIADCCQARPWLGQVTGPTEACVAVLARVAPEHRDGPTRLELSTLEVPSALALVRRRCPGVDLAIAPPLPPDMVTPLGEGRVLWRYEGGTAYPTLEPPLAASAERLVAVATPSWPHPVAAYDRALPLGQLAVEELLALLVHPPARPDALAGLPEGWWERTAQVFACLGILHCEQLSSGTPGDSAPHRGLLAGIACGIEDWTTEAALFALTVAAWLDPSCREEVRGIVARRFLDGVAASGRRVVTILDSLAELVLIVPDMLPEVATLARDVLARAEDRASGGTARPRTCSLLRRLTSRRAR